jgi:hypothetical protein
VSQYVADLLAIHVGLPALVRELTLVRELNQAAVAHGPARAVAPLRGDRLMIRPRREVSQRLAHMATEAGYPPGRVSPYIADVLAEHVGLHRRRGKAAAPAADREKGAAIDIQREPAAKTAAGPPIKKAVTGREAARAEMRRLAQRAAERRSEQAAREAVRREATVRSVRHPQPAAE